jgi:hypothetical protein
MTKTFLQAPIAIWTGEIFTGAGGTVNYSGIWENSTLIWARNASLTHNYNLSSQNRTFAPNSHNQNANRETSIEFDYAPTGGDPFLNYLTGDVACQINFAGVHLSDVYLNTLETSLAPQSPIFFKASLSSFGNKTPYNLNSGDFFQNSDIEVYSSAFAAITGHQTFPTSGVPTSFNYRLECRRSLYQPSDSLYPENVTLDSLNIKVSSECLVDEFNNFASYSGATGAMYLSIKNQANTEIFNLRVSGVMSDYSESLDTDKLPMCRYSIEETRF